MELIVTIAIIAILAVIGVPAYKTFQAKARQKEGFLLLNTFYTAAQATRGEFNIYPGNFVATAFAPAGLLGYSLRSDDNANNLPGATAFTNDDTCIHTSDVCDCGGNCPNYKTWNERPTGVIGSSVGPSWTVSSGGCATLAWTGTADNNFVVGVAGVISTTATAPDRYYMNELKQIEMCSDGLK